MKLRQAGSWDVLFALEGFVSPIDKQRMVTGVVVGDYKMSESTGLRPCGISECQTPHRHGFIVELSDDSVSHVGRHCGKRHFDANWSHQLKRLRSARKTIAREKALADARELASLAAKRPIGYDETRLARVRSFLKAFDALPNEVRTSLESRAAENDKEIYAWRDPTEQEIKAAKFHGEQAPSRVRFTLTNFEGLLAVRRSQRADRIVDERIPEIIATLNNLNENGTVADEIHAQIRRLESAQDELFRSMDSAELFFKQTNIEKLSHLSQATRLGITQFWFEELPYPAIKWTANDRA